MNCNDNVKLLIKYQNQNYVNTKNVYNLVLLAKFINDEISFYIEK